MIEHFQAGTGNPMLPAAVYLLRRNCTGKKKNKTEV
jgi:hypothetical protein